MNIFSTIADISVIISSLVVGVVAIKGLSIWKREHVGKQGYNVARNLLKAIYQLHAVIDDFRNPFYYDMEYPSEIPESIVDSEEIEYYNKNYIFKIRKQNLFESFKNVREAYFESVIEWGANHHKIYDDQIEFLSDLTQESNTYIQNLRRGENQEDLKRELLFNNHPETNPYSEKLDNLLKDFDTWLRPLMMNQKKK